MAKDKMYKNSFMGEGRGPSTLPEPCRTCYGFSNWKGDTEHVLYEDRDCSECGNRSEE